METPNPAPADLLEAFALDQLPPLERAQVARALALDPALRAELAAIEDALQALAQAEAVPPPPALRARVLTAVDHAIAAADVLPPASEPFGQRAPNSVTRWQSPAWLVAIASVAMLVVASVLVLGLERRLTRTEAELADLQRRNMRTDSLVQRNQLTAQTLALEFDLRVTGYRQVRLAAVKPDRAASAIVYWNGSDGSVYFVGRMPAPPPGKQYQLWALRDGKPIDAGVLAPGADGLATMKQIEAADAFAVTLEPAGGSEQPTLSELTVLGEVRPS